MNLDPILSAIGECGRHLAGIGASEGAAGNISVLLPAAAVASQQLIDESVAPTPIECPNLAGRAILVTGSGTRLREIHLDPYANLAYVEILPGLTPAEIHAVCTEKGLQPTWFV